MNLFKSFDNNLGQYMRKAARPLGSMEIESKLLEGQSAPSPWCWCLLVVCDVVDGLMMSRAHCM
jgi:hypothetical protein